MARILNIGTQNYTTVLATDELYFNANHEYVVVAAPAEGEEIGLDNPYAKVKFQEGPIKEYGVNGCHNEDLIAIVIDRLEHLNQGQFACRENSIAITKLTEALLWLNKRTNDRIKRGVEGTHQV